MIWLVWRRRRATLLTATSLVAVFVVVLVAGRFSFVSHVQTLGVDRTCLDVVTDACRRDALAAIPLDGPWGYGVFWGLGHSALLATPLVLGLLVGTGLFGREFDEGTHVLALTQGTSVTRWWTSALLVAGVPVAVLTGLLGVVAEWAYAPFRLASYPFSPLETPVFEISGIVPVAYALLAFTLAAGTGLVTRGGLPPVVVAVVGYGIAMLVLATLVRQHYLPAEIVRQSVDPARPDAGINDVADAWQIERRWVDDQGVTRAFAGCDRDDSFVQCLREAGITGSEVRIQPDSRYWPFQLIETAILLTLSAVALVLTRPRLAGLAAHRAGVTALPKSASSPTSRCN